MADVRDIICGVDDFDAVDEPLAPSTLRFVMIIVRRRDGIGIYGLHVYKSRRVQWEKGCEMHVLFKATSSLISNTFPLPLCSSPSSPSSFK